MRLARMVVVAVVVLGIAGLVLSQEGQARPSMVYGTLVKVTGTNLVVKTMARGTAEAKEVTVATNDKTQFTVDGEPGKLADLKVDMRITASPAEGPAERVRATTKGLEGTIVKVDGKNVIVKTGRGDAAKEVTVATDEKTKVIIGDKVSTLADLKADMRVTVIPETGTAVKILASAVRAGGGRRGGGAGGAAR